MARVFVSYRRADGLYPVGWIAERLRALDAVTGIQTAFHDSVLRPGDDLADALDDEIAACDVVIAVVTPRWRGDRPTGQDRIMDDDDWIVRELASALRQDKHIVPVLVDGADHPLPSEMHASIGAFSRLLAVPFADGADLDRIIEHVADHLDELDRDRARLAGLEEPVQVPELERMGMLAGLATVAALVGALLGAISAGVMSPWPFDAATTEAIDGSTAHVWSVGLLIALGLASGVFGVFGVAVLARLTRFVVIDWTKIGLLFAATGGIALVLVLSSQTGDLLRAEPAPLPGLAARAAVSSALALAAIAPWAVCLVAPFGSRPRAEDHEIGRRVQTLALLRDAERWGVISGATILTISGAAGLALLGAAYQADLLPNFETVPNIGFAALESLLLGLAHIAAITRLRDQQVTVVRSLEGLPPRYRSNALPRLAARSLDDGGWAFRALLFLPALVATVGTISIIATA